MKSGYYVLLTASVSEVTVAALITINVFWAIGLSFEKKRNIESVCKETANENIWILETWGNRIKKNHAHRNLFLPTAVYTRLV